MIRTNNLPFKGQLGYTANSIFLSLCNPFLFLIAVSSFCLIQPLNSYAQEGVLDANFNQGGIRSTSGIYAIQVMPDKKILIGGNNTNYNGITVNQLTRLNEDGSRDATFNAGGTGVGGTLRDIKLQSNGKIIIAGSFTSYNGNACSNICRLNSDGSFDNTFSLGGAGFNGTIQEIAVLSDDKIIAGGSFSTLNGVTVNRLVRLNSNGSFDNTFGGGSRANTHVYAIKVTSAGKIIIGGNFATYNGVTVNRIARLNSDGTLDGTFNAGGTRFNAEVFAIDLYFNDKIIVGGNFTTFNGVAHNRLARLNADGSLDNSFSILTGFNNQINAIINLSGGGMIVAGQFTTYRGVAANRIIRILANGDRDLTWNPGGTAANNSIYSLAIQPDRKLLVGGDQQQYNGVSWNRIIRLNNSFAVLPDQTIDLTITKNSLIHNVQWSLESPSQIKYFELEQSENGINFYAIKTVNTSNSQKYDVTLQNNNKKLYYRIKATCNDLSVIYSAIYTISFSNTEEAMKMKAFPNPVMNQLTIELPGTSSGKIQTIKLYNANGTLVKNYSINQSSSIQILNVVGLQVGAYYLSVSTTAGTYTTKIIKN